MEEQQPVWYDITIAGKRFNVASRHGEAHIREVERLLEQTFAEVQSRLKQSTGLNAALLVALNLADQLLALQREQSGATSAWDERMASMLVRLNEALGEPAEDGDSTSATGSPVGGACEP